MKVIMGRSLVNFLFFILLSIVIVIYYTTDKNSELKLATNNEIDDSTTKYILFWKGMWSYEDFLLGLGKDIFKHCPIKNCVTMSRRNGKSLDQFDAFVMHGVEYNENRINNPLTRNPNQVYIYMNLESPFNSFNHQYTPEFFNWTMTYRVDSDIYRPYGITVRNTTGYKLPTIEDIQKRPKKIAWFVSRCRVASKRDVLAYKIKQYMPVDIYGECGALKCDRGKLEECYDMMESKYKFYLSFENSICKDYVTEKLFYILQRNVIPIVYGGADYEKVAPPHSVIDVTKYKTVKELTDYLKFLDENPKEYLKYFEWKKSYSIDTTPERSTLCQLCQKLHEPRREKSYYDVIGWLKAPGICKSGQDLPPIVHS